MPVVAIAERQSHVADDLGFNLVGIEAGSEATPMRDVQLRKFDGIAGGVVDDLAHALKPALAALFVVRIPLD